MTPLQDQTITSIPETVTFECVVSKKKVPVEWYKGDRQIRSGDKYDLISDETTHKLVIKDADDKDEGDYKIIVKNTPSTAKLHVKVAPKIMLDKKYEDVLVLRRGASAVVEVPFKGNPQPTVSWKMDGKPVTERDRIKVETIYNMTALTLSKVEPDDAGSYILSLENENGKATVTIKVKVLGKRDI